ncbi:glycerophosphodiester phosphodiesterase [Rheinheimera riviphila]|uniref:glycerophosphodiester phosphodiesterase n=1 Tax=Rheinheimera riviphila TaxID=1834037 RepID=A0A437R2E9_9GAMM|nr:glycerophosphodiester phosphodiesterase family protein [Rheinheimera riviphila]RVU40893.1 glycerophosphodiester phosphodiesterase [Rheinheimera riviphila]
MRWLLLLLSFNVAAACPQWPLVIAHRGASGYLPEHSLAAYQRALEQGADIIEADLVPTKDGVLISRHENELSTSTDIASRPEFASRKTQKIIDGIAQEGWFSEDFTLAELRRIKARESMPQLRPQSAAFDGQFDLVTLPEILQLLQRHRIATGRQVGLYLETKHPTYFAHAGSRLDGSPIHTDLSTLLVAQLQQYKDMLPAEIYIQSFEMLNLWQLKHQLLPDSELVASNTKIQLIQLLGDTEQAYMLPKGNFSEPYDVVYWRGQQSPHPAHAEVAKMLPTLSQPGFHYGDLFTPQGWQALASYADGIGPWRSNLYRGIDEKNPVLHSVVNNARQAGLLVHPYTFRIEDNYLTKNADGTLVPLSQDLQWLFSQGISGVFSDFPDVAVQARAKTCSATAR